MKVRAQEDRTSSFPRPQMSELALSALAVSYVRYLMQRTGKSAEYIQDRFYTDKGLHAERAPFEFRKWAGQRVYVMDQLRRDPFEAEREAW